MTEDVTREVTPSLNNRGLARSGPLALLESMDMIASETSLGVILMVLNDVPEMGRSGRGMSLSSK